MAIPKLLLLFVATQAAFGSYSAVATISISHVRAGSSDLTNFPVLVAGTYSQMASVANGGLVTSASGYDIVFTSDSGCTSKLNWQIEYWNASGTVAYWVGIPVLSHTADNAFYACVGNTAVTTDQSSPAAVWNSAYVGVWHFPNGTSLSAADSTSYGNNGTAATATATAGKVDGGAHFASASSQNIVVADSSSLQTSVLTVEGWVYIPSLPYAYQQVVRKGYPWCWQINNANQFALVIDNNYYVADAGASVGWQHVTFAYDGAATVTTYLNGAQVNSRNAGAISLDSTNVYIGSAETGIEYLNGILDELRISNVVRPANWIAADYANQASPGTFYSLNFPVPGAIATASFILW